MKYLNQKLIGLALLATSVVACTDEYDCNLLVEKPEDVKVSEYLASFDVLKSYIDRAADSPFKLTANMSAADFTGHEVAYSILMDNFDGLDIGNTYTPVNSSTDGEYDFSGMQLLTDAVREAGVTLYAGTLCSNQNQPATYFNKLIEPIVIPFEPLKGKTVICDFENDELGTSYEMTGGSQAVVENDPEGKTGKVLHVGTEDDKAAYSHPKFHVVLPAGHTLGNYVSLSIDMRIVNQDGLYGAGMKVFINGQEFSVGTNAQGIGCNPNTWNRGAVISLTSDKAPGFIVPDALKDLTEFDLAVGSASSAAQYYLDNITMSYEIGSGVTKINFDNDEAGKTYPMTGNSQAVVEDDPLGDGSGKVLHVGTASTLCYYSYPKFNVKLQEGYSLGSYSGISLDMYLIDGKGKYGSGMRVIINGQEFNTGKGPSAYGCPDNAWGRQLIYIPFIKEGEENPGGAIEIPNSMKDLTEIELAIGSGSGEWHAYIDNINLYWEGDDTIIEKTPEEKTALFTAELNKWIGGMIDAGGETVTVWNVIGEPLSTTVDANTFKWAEYLGDVDYARTAVKMARDTAKVDLKLFVSNTIAQSDAMGQKINELSALVDSWEADNVTKIDGYNILLHTVYSKDVEVQEANQKAISELFAQLAATNKLVRISDLSVEIADADGNLITANQVITSDRMAAADYLAFIMQEYQKTIAKDKQYGISISSMTESGTGTKICPWTSGYNRNEMYEGVVNGLKQE